MKFTVAMCAALLMSPIVSSRATAAERSRTGFPVANFGIGAEVSPAGRILGRIVYNPPRLGRWLEDVAEGYVAFEVNGRALRDEAFQNHAVTRRWPFARGKMSDPGFQGLNVEYSVFAPVAVDNAFDTSLPAVFVEFTFVNASSATVAIGVDWHCEGEACREMAQAPADANCRLLSAKGLSAAAAVPCRKTSESGGAAVRWTVAAKPGGRARLRFVVFRFHPDGYTMSGLRMPSQFAAYALRQWDFLRVATQSFSNNLPASHNPALDEALRWYMTAAVLMTKLTASGGVLTMGYTELNQRDSYWTTFPHLVYWPTLERRMIEESAAAQSPNGKVPTTILPVIERDDIDTDCYFVMRILRWTAFRKDKAFLRRMWPNARAAMRYVAALDRDGDGLPDQRTYWADWKDVAGVEGRKYGPHFSLLWLAALKRTARRANEAGDAVSAAEFEALYARGLATVNKPVAAGGLWNGTHYVNVWNDGRRDDRVLEDQVVGVLFDVVDAERTASIFKALGPSENAWGVRDTYEYYPESFGFRGGDYHNGAIWPWLNFVDALARIRKGRSADGARIMEKVAHADLVLHGDYLPHENIDGETGENTHHYIQAWNAAYFAAFYFGIMEPDAKFF